MENTAYIGLSQANALKQWMDVTANNVANMSTPGFKAQDMLFKEYLSKPRDGDKISMVIDYGTFRNTEQGPMQQTHNKLDFALQGDGFFAIQTDKGVRYTRDGSFALNDKNQIVTQEGFPVLGTTSQPIAVQPGTSHISVTGGGNVSTELGEVGKFKLVKFEKEQDLTPVGYNMYDAVEQQEQTADGTSVLQGMIEGSNVKPVVEMNKMIEILRLYQQTAKMLQSDHDLQRSVISKLTRS